MKRMQIIQSTFLVGMLFVLSMSCKYDEVLPFEPDPGVPVLFNQDIIPMFENICNSTGCHNGTQSPDLRAAVAYDNLAMGGYLNTETAEQSLLYLWKTDAMDTRAKNAFAKTDDLTFDDRISYSHQMHKITHLTYIKS